MELSMPRQLARWLVGVVVLVLAALPAASQQPALRILSVGPTGDLADLADADELRIVFSDPMIAIGSVPSGAPPAWIHITPQPAGSFYWTGTKTLQFSPASESPLPYATRYVVRVDAGATSLDGRALGAPYEFSFTTPTVRLLGADWYRKDGRADSPAIVALRFNQRVRPGDVLAHTRATLTPHVWTPPQLSARTREWMRQYEPDGLRRFDAKVAAARAVTESRDPIALRVATSWNEERFPRNASVVVVETESPPPTDGWLTLAVDAAMPSMDGPATHAAQSTVVRLEPTFFAMAPRCDAACNPDQFSSIGFNRQVELGAVAPAFRLVDATDGRDVRVPPARSPRPETATRQVNGAAFVDLGYDPLPAFRTWRYRVDPNLRSIDGQTLGYPAVAIVETLHAMPLAGYTGSVWESGGGPLPLVARNVEAVSEWRVALGVEDLIPRLRQLRSANAAFPPAPPIERVLPVRPDVFDAHGTDLRTLFNRPSGLLWTAVSPSRRLDRSFVGNVTRPQNSIIQVTNLGVSVKDSPASTLVFVTRLDNGAAVPGANVSIVDAASATRWRGVTDASGIAIAPAMTLRDPNRVWDLQFIVAAEKDGDLAYVGSDWQSDVQSWRFGYRYDLREADGVLRASVFTDRGVYKEDEDVHVKAIVRDDRSAGLTAFPDGAAFDVVIRDARGREADRRVVRANRWSSADWTWRVPPDAALGYYNIDIAPQGATPNDYQRHGHGGFLVAAYRRPDFRVDATLESTPPIAGATLRGTVQAKYLFGAALADRPVRWWFTRYPALNVPAPIAERYPGERYGIGYWPEPAANRQPTPLPQKTEVLGADGRLSTELATRSEGDSAYSYTLEGDVTDVSGQHIANRASLIVHPASFYVAVARPPLFADTRTPLNVGVAAVSLDGKPVASVSVTLALFREQWRSVTRPENPGSSTWERDEIASGQWTVRTTTADRPVAVTVKEGGSYILRATARDAEGRPTRTDVRFYATGPGRTFWRTEGNKIDLTPERVTWAPGETARVLIQSPWERATALLTVEREGVRSHRTFDITSTQQTVDVPLTAADVPNVYVSVMLVKGRTREDVDAQGEDAGRPDYRLGYTQLMVRDPSKSLSVTVSADRDDYRPAQPATISVKVTPRAGRPMPAEVTFWAMDHGILSLTGYRAPDVVSAIYAPKALQVATADIRQRLMTRRALLSGVAAGAAGGAGGGRGGGGGGLGQMGDVLRSSTVSGLPMEAISITMDSLSESVAAAAPMASPAPPPPGELRTDFRPLVFWLGSATVDADGVAKTTVTLPDSLTTYRIVAVAGNERSEFGVGEHEIRVTKPLTLLPSFPRFLAKGDRASFGAVVTNSTSAPGDATVTIETLDPATLSFAGARTQTLRIAPGESEPVRFDATAAASGMARVRMVVSMGGERDAFEMPLPVVLPLRPDVTAAYGETTASAIERIVLPTGALPAAGGLSVELASTALVGLGESARYLTEYPYECAEQRASRALALLLAADLGGAFQLANTPADRYRSEGLSALSSLYGYQCGSGGFAFWPGRCGVESEYLTAYVLHVMKVAESLKAPIDRSVTEQGLNFLQQRLRQPPPEAQWYPVWSASQAFSVKTLAEFGRNPEADIRRLADVAERLPIFALSYLADALAATGDRGPRYAGVVRRLTNAVRLDADRAHVEEVDDAALAWLWNTNVRATAVTLDGLARRGDDASLVAPMVRWLIGAQRNGRWETTHENGAAMEALVSYYRAFEREVPQMTASVRVGDTRGGGGAFSGRSSVAQRVDVPMADLVRQIASAAAPSLTIARDGTGKLFYTARLRTFAPESPEAVDRGFQVARRYTREDVTTATAAGSPAVPSASMTTFEAGDLIRVTVAVTLRGEGRYLALTDPLPAGLEPLDGWFQTTASDLGRVATRMTGQGSDWLARWRRGTFDHVEKHDDRVVAFATRLGSGRHEFSYLVRATTSGTFTAAGARVEAMYAPEVTGRSAASTITVK
jgi:uncharacterized protein YfaS (alpha-2-macroglobulin family)